jgi:hypothetical protein
MARWKQGDWALSMDPRQNTGLSPCHMGGVQHHLEASEGRVPSSWCPPKRAQAWAFGFCHRNTLGVFRVCFTFGGRESCRKVISRYAYIYNCTWHWSLGLCVCPSNFPKALSDVYCHKRKLEAFLLSWFSESFWIIWNYLFREGLNNSLKKLGVPLSISHNLFLLLTCLALCPWGSSPFLGSILTTYPFLEIPIRPSYLHGSAWSAAQPPLCLLQVLFYLWLFLLLHF